MPEKTPAAPEKHSGSLSGTWKGQARTRVASLDGLPRVYACEVVVVDVVIVLDGAAANTNAASSS
jgi:hypothetical protein